MGWKQRIVTLLNLLEKSPKIISDTTGVLFSQTFKHYLEKEKVKVIYSDTNSKMLASANNNEQVTYITTKEIVPQFLKSYFEHKTFEYAQLPLNGDVSILRSYDAEAIVSICNYIFANNPHTLLSKSNSKELLEKAKEFDKLKDLQEVKMSVNAFLEA